jgi:tetratricopeptide (TPR) repeat protein
MKRADYYRRFPPECHADVFKKTPAKWPFVNHFRIVFGAILALFFAANCVSASPPDARIDDLIAQLTSEDAMQRSSAAMQLLQIGRPARPAILRAARSDDPDLHDRAAQILLQMPWYLPSDPEPIKQVLRHYGVPDLNQRRTFITNEIAPMRDPAAFDVLVRLMAEDPSVDVRWTIAGLFRRLEQGALLSRYRHVEPDQDDPPMLALCAYARLDTNSNQARQFLQRCADLEFANPSDDPEFDYVIQLLCEFAVRDNQYAAAADLRRKQYARGATSDESGTPVPILELFALQGDYGPLPGLDNDMKLAGSAAQTPKIEYCLSRLYAREGKPSQSQGAHKAAFNASHTRMQRYNVGSFLADHGWDDLAEAEFNNLLQMPPDPDDQPYQVEVNARFQLAAIAIRRGDDFAAARNTELALRAGSGDSPLIRTDERGHIYTVSTNDIWAEVHWHYLRAAQAKHDDATVAQQLDALVPLNPTDPEIAIDAVPLLKQRGQSDAAESLFNRAFDSMKAKLDTDPDNPDLLNSMAWLCAECNEHLTEALAWSQESVAILPNDAAVIDTLADVNFRLGHAKKAVELESRAVKLDSTDTFMPTQLAKFRAAAATEPSGGQ